MQRPLVWILSTLTALVVFTPVRAALAQEQNTTPAPAPAAPVKHTMTVHFDYDFNGTPACPQPENKPCVEQFIVYDISAGILPEQRFKLFTVPVPPDAKGEVKGITGTSPPLAFESGKHLIAVTAEMPDKRESNPGVCQFWVTIP